MTRTILAALLACGLPAGPVPAQTAPTTPRAARAAAAAPAGAETITAAQLRDYLAFVASDEMEGRDTPSRGLDATAKFIVTLLSRWGLEPAGENGTFFQKITLLRSTVDRAAVRAEVSGRALAHGTEFLAEPTSGSASGGLVYAGFGWQNPEQGLDPLAGLDVRGKIVVVNYAVLPPGADFSALAPGSKWVRPADAARRAGAAGVVKVLPARLVDNVERLGRLIETPPFIVDRFRISPPPSLPTVVLTPAAAAPLFEGEAVSAADVEAVFAGAAPKAVALSPAKTASFSVSAREESATASNVVAAWRGADPALRDEYVAVSAHYDHVGVAAGTPPGADAIHNGADDDGSGTVALLAMAEALARAPRRPNRSVLFVWHCGEEKGLWGSRYYTETPTVPLDRIVALLNIDMIGRSKAPGDETPANADLSGPDELYLIGSRSMSPDLGDLVERVNDELYKLRFNYRYDDPAEPSRLFYRSDHINYARKGVPVAFFFSGVHEDYHGTDDEVEKIDFAKMERVARTVYAIAWRLAGQAARPRVEKAVP